MRPGDNVNFLVSRDDRRVGVLGVVKQGRWDHTYVGHSRDDTCAEVDPLGHVARGGQMAVCSSSAAVDCRARSRGGVLFLLIQDLGEFGERDVRLAVDGSLGLIDPPDE